VANTASSSLLKWTFGSACRMQQLLLIASPLGARLHALALELVHTPGGARSAGAAVRGSVCLCRCVC